MNKTHIENLRILGNFLIDYKGECGFNMAGYAENKNDPELYSPSTMRSVHKINCDTIACALGHAPLISKFMPREHDSWTSYGERLFGKSESTDETGEWFWCFGIGWKTVDNTRIGAGKRILWLCDHGLPENWNAQMDRTTELCYE